ncbi:thermonuclease family protein [Candidatus Pacearchaeota archaeon]|nr:thermonuclease family protein [Candidatus Pacearchaeota archaeon]
MIRLQQRERCLLLRKIHAVLLALAFTAVIFNLISLPKVFMEPERESVIITRVIDGDTLEIADGRVIRLLNINAPEKTSPLSSQATLFLRQFINSSIDIEITGTEKYGRLLARIYAPDYVNLRLVELGLASKFLVQKEESELFASAESAAVQGEKGIWKRSSYAPCLSAKINAEEEIVLLKNACDLISLEGWLLKDESRKTFKLESTLTKDLIIKSGQGITNETILFLNAESVWNNDKDTLYLFDEQGNLALHHAYGY